MLFIPYIGKGPLNQLYVVRGPETRVMLVALSERGLSIKEHGGVLNVTPHSICFISLLSTAAAVSHDAARSYRPDVRADVGPLNHIPPWFVIYVIIILIL